MIAARQIVEFVNEIAVVSACVQVHEELGNGDGEKSHDASIDAPPVLLSGLVQRMILIHFVSTATGELSTNPQFEIRNSQSAILRLLQCPLMAAYYGRTLVA
jgi:hypothetical protein